MSVAAGQAVIDDLGVIGQVTRVFPLTSEVTLLTDKNQSIPVQVQRNGLRAVLAGAGSGAMELKFLPANADVQPDDIAGHLRPRRHLPGGPAGGEGHSIDRDNSFSFARIECTPLAGVERHGQVLLLGKRKTPPIPDEPTEIAKKSAKGRKIANRPK